MKSIQRFNNLAREYDGWFDENREVYKAEIETLATMVPKIDSGLEIGVGTGRFAAPLGIRMGIDPARRALRYALTRDIFVCQAVGERLPFECGRFDFALLNTVDPFVNDLHIILTEIHRVLNPQGQIIIGMIDKDSHLGQIYDAEKDKDPFFRDSHFHSAKEMIHQLHSTGFSNIICRQTLMGGLHNAAHEGETIANPLAIRDGYGEGGFVALRADKSTFKQAAKVTINTEITISNR